MSLPRGSGRLLPWLFCIFMQTLAFNLDSEAPLRKNGPGGSLFGFSLALHHQLQPAERKLLLIGAPHAKAQANEAANITGGVFSCGITSVMGDCERIELDHKDNDPNYYKENEWMGVTVHSQGSGGHVVTCAHRFQWHQGAGKFETRRIVGRCLLLSQDLQAVDGTDGSRMFCQTDPRRVTQDNHLGFGSCQQGLSVAFTEDGRYLAFGAAGSYNWKGIVRVEQVELDDFDDVACEVGDENNLNPKLDPVPDDSYLGFSLVSGMNLTEKGRLTIVSGAPRADLRGQVLLLRRDPQVKTMLSAEYVLQGPSLAASFGYDVAVVDLNGDGWQDLAVGAPQFFLKDGDVGGAAYIYINQAGKDWDKIQPVRLEGNSDSMFGLAVENLGDINQDKYEDLAVGAPYDGAGKVFVYLGSSKGVIQRPSQVLLGKSHNVVLFGYSLAGNMDLDGNLYPDMVVGSLSDAVFIYRARPVINLKKNLRITPSSIDMTRGNCERSVCMLTVHACFSYNTVPETFNPRMTISYELAADSERTRLGLLPRASFVKTTEANPDPSRGNIILQRQNEENCNVARLQLQTGIQDTLNSIPVAMSVSLVSSDHMTERISLPELNPILNQPHTAASQVGFVVEGCGRDNICQSKLALEYKFCSRKNGQASTFTPLPLENGVAVISPGEDEIALEITVTNKNGDDAYICQFVGTFPAFFPYSSFSKKDDTQVWCNANENGTEVKCDLGNPFRRDAHVTFYIIASTAQLSLSATRVPIDLRLETISKQSQVVVKAEASVVFDLRMDVVGLARPSQVYLGGTEQEAIYTTPEEEIGSLIEYEFRIANRGRPLKSFATAILEIQWPKQTTKGEPLLHLVDISNQNKQKLICSPQHEIGLLSQPAGSHQRSKRDSPPEKLISRERIFSIFSKTRKHKTLACGNGTDCMRIRCPLPELDSNTVVIFRSRLCNKTLIQNYADLDYIDIVFDTIINLTNAPTNIGLQPTNTTVRLTVFPEKREIRYSQVAWWVIFLSVLLGILMLILLGLLLWKCGCFDSSKKDADASDNHSAHLTKEDINLNDTKSHSEC